MANEINCPRCGSPSVTANKKGFSAGKALAGDLIAGPIGLLAGGMGSNKVIITCLACGHKFKPGDYYIANLKNKERNGTLTAAEAANLKTHKNGQIFALIVTAGIVIWFGTCWFGSEEKNSATNSTSPVPSSAVVMNNSTDNSANQSDIIEVRIPKAGCKWYDDAAHTQPDLLSPFTKDVIDAVTLYVTADDGQWLTFRLMPVNEGDEIGRKYWCKKKQTEEK